jgi:hypothetical protein
LNKIVTVVCLVTLSSIAGFDYYYRGQIRKTFEFKTEEGTVAVEERLMNLRGEDEEIALQRYVEEWLYGPLSPELLSVFPSETVVLTLIYRDGTMYLNVSESAVFAQPDIFTVGQILERGVYRNFPTVKNIHLFVEGHEVMFSQTHP